MKHGGRQLKIESNYKWMLQASAAVGTWMAFGCRVFKSVDNEINTVAIANSQTNDNCLASEKKQRLCSMWYWPVCMLDQMLNYQLNTLSDGDAIDAIPLPLL